MPADLYETLDVPRDADEAAIKAAHRRAVKANHPDAGGSVEAFDRVQKAFAVLSDQRRREHYDQTGVAGDEDSIDTLKAKAMAEVMRRVQQAVLDPGVDPARTDLVAYVRRQIAEERRQGLEGIAQAKAQQKRLAQFLRRLKRKSGIAQLHEPIQNHIDNISGGIGQTEVHLRLLAAADEMVAEYVYEVDRAPPPPQGMTWERLGGGSVYRPGGIFDNLG